MNTVDILSHTSTLQRMRKNMYSTPYINITENKDKYAFNRKLIQHGTKLKWETKRMGWCWFPSLNVHGMTLVFLTLVLNYFSIEWKLFSKVCDPLMVCFSLSLKLLQKSFCTLSTKKTQPKFESIWPKFFLQDFLDNSNMCTKL
jgi:hypothetical protein